MILYRVTCSHYIDGEVFSKWSSSFVAAKKEARSLIEKTDGEIEVHQANIAGREEMCTVLNGWASSEFFELKQTYQGKAELEEDEEDEEDEISELLS